MKNKGAIRFEKAIKKYINLFGTSNDIFEYLSTWDYSDEDWNELSEKIENCVKQKNV